MRRTVLVKDMIDDSADSDSESEDTISEAHHKVAPKKEGSTMYYATLRSHAVAYNMYATVQEHRISTDCCLQQPFITTSNNTLNSVVNDCASVLDISPSLLQLLLRSEENTVRSSSRNNI